MREQPQPAARPRLLLLGVLSCLGGVASAACPPGMLLLDGKCQEAQVSVQALCSAQVINANPDLVTSKAPGDKEKLQALIAACVKNYDEQQARATRKERQFSWLAAPGAASSSPIAAAPLTPSARTRAGAPQSARSAAQGPAPVNPIAVAKPLPDVSLACSVILKGINYSSGWPQREFEIHARNDSGASLAAGYRIIWTAESAVTTKTGSEQLHAPLAANASVKVGTALVAPNFPLKSCRALARF